MYLLFTKRLDVGNVVYPIEKCDPTVPGSCFRYNKKASEKKNNGNTPGPNKLKIGPNKDMRLYKRDDIYIYTHKMCIYIYIIYDVSSQDCV